MDGSVIKSNWYVRINIAKLSQKMEPNEIMKLENAYVGRDVHFQTRCVIYHQGQEQKKKH